MRRFLSIAFVLLCSSALFGQGAVTTTLQVQNSGTTVFTRSGFIRWNFTSGCTASVVSGSLNVSCTGGAGNPGGTANQIQYNSAGTAFAGFTMSGDCTIVVATGVITCTKTNNVAFAASATTDATNATNIGSGTLNAARLPATAVLTNQANTFSTGLQDMSAADYLMPKHASDPATCTEGQLEENTTSHVVKFCSALNTWTSLGAGGGGTTTNALTMNNSNSGAASGTTFDGSVARTISTNTIGAPNLATANTFTTGLQDMSAADYLQPKHASDPGTCTEGQIEENTTSHLMKLCSATNTWSTLLMGSFSGNTTVAVSAGTGVNTATTQTHLVADGSGNAIPQSKITTVGMGGVWTNGMPFGIPVTIGTVATPVNTTMYVQQFPVVNQQTIGNATFDATTCASCAEVVNACLYDSTAATLLWSGVSATFNATGAFSATGTQATIQPGVYYFAYSFSGTTAPSVQGYSAGAGATDNILNKNGTRVATATNGISGGLCPSSLGVLNPSTGTAAHVAFALEP